MLIFLIQGLFCLVCAAWAKELLPFPPDLTEIVFYAMV